MPFPTSFAARLIVVGITLALGLAACGEAGGGAAAPTPATSSARATSSPSRPDPLVFAVKGDWGAANNPQREITRQMCAVREFVPFDVVMTVGDNFYETGTATRENYFEPERCLYERDGHVWRAAWGNHDDDGDTERVLGAARWYAWSSKGVDFFMLDSNRPNDEQQRTWLARRLAASDAAVKIVAFHHPAFTVGSEHHPSATIQRNWVPLFKRHGVRMVLAGHNHLYEHFRVDGIDYVTTGGGGASLYRCEGTHPALRRCLRVFHFLLVQIDGERIEVRALNIEGDVLDRFVSRPA